MKYIVEETLEGRAAHLKERTLGVEVFGREPSYDTNQDPVVRTSAAQVRHRLIHYYAEPGHENEIRIELLPGAYVPRFRPPGSDSPCVPETSLRVEVDLSRVRHETAVVPEKALAHDRLKRYWHWRYAVAALLACCLAAALLVSRYWSRADGAAMFWGPVWDKSTSVVVCVPGKFPTSESPTQTSGVVLPANRDPQTPLTIWESLHLNSITWPDATTVYMLVGFIQANGQVYQVRRERDSSFSDLRNGSLVLVGGFNNDWLLRLANRYRFTYHKDQELGWIRDAQNPTRRDWKVSWNAPYSSFDIDYGVISRIWDPSTEHWVVVASGIASYGTIAAGAFLTKPEYLDMIAQRAPKGWEKKNLQVLFSTKVFNGNAGPPMILAIHVW